MIAAAYKAGAFPRREFAYSYSTIARKLNQYIRKYKSMSAVEQIAEADYIIFFNLLEYRRTVSGLYPYGELVVIRQGKSGTSQPPQIIWKARKVMWAEDAIKEFIKTLKRVRGEN